MDAASTIQTAPVKYSKFFVSKLYPSVPFLGDGGLPALFQVAILGSPIMVESPWPMSMYKGAFLYFIGSVIAHNKASVV